VEGLVGRRYASALFDAAQEQDVVDQVEQDLNVLLEVWEKNPELPRLLVNPNVDLGEKREFLDRVFPEELTELVRRFLDFLLEKKRIEHFVPAVAEYHELAEEKRRRCEAFVTSRMPLSESQRERLTEALKRLMRKDICLIEETDPDVIGGLRVRIRDRVIDRTLRSELVQLRENLLAARLLEPRG
jgi:F-type H+-transporting ATPase subunit delta